MSSEERITRLETLVCTQGREIDELRREKDGMIKKGLYVLGAGLTGAGIYIWRTHVG